MLQMSQCVPPMLHFHQAAQIASSKRLLLESLPKLKSNFGQLERALNLKLIDRFASMRTLYDNSE